MAYDGFISYSHAADGRLAPALQRGLQRLAKSWNSRRALRIFRDETGLSTNPHLWSAIEGALDESEWFVLLASPEAARSEWVNKEIAHWLATKSVDHMLPVVTDGTWEWDAAAGDFTAASSAVPDAFRGALANEPRHLDLRWARSETDLDLRNSRFRSAVADLAAPMHGVPKDELEGEDIRQHRRARRIARAGVSALAILVVIAVGLGVLAQKSRDDAVKSRNHAVTVGNTARAQALAAESLNELSTDPVVSVLLARQAVQVAPIPQAVAALRQALDASAVRVAFPTESNKPCTDDGGPTIAYNPAGDRVAESVCTGDLVVHDSTTGKVLYRRHVAAQATAVAYDPHGHVLAVGTDKGIDLVDPANGEPKSRLSGPGVPNALAFSADGSLLAATTNLGTTVWDLESHTPRFSLTEPERDHTVAFTPNGQSLVVGTLGPSEVVDVASGRIVHILTPTDRDLNEQNANPVAVSGNLLVVAENVNVSNGVAAYVDVWDTQTWTMRNEINPVIGTSVTSVAISRDGTKIAQGNADGTGSIWSEATNEKLVALMGQTSVLGTVSFNPDGTKLATASNDGTARIYRADGPWLSTHSALLCTCGNEIGWQRHKLLALARAGDNVLVQSWTQPDGHRLPDFPVLSGNQESLGAALSRDGTRAALWNDDGPSSSVRVFDTATARKLFTLPAVPIAGVAFSDDDRLLVVDDASGNMHISSIADRNIVVGHGWSANCPGGGGVAISPDNRLVAVRTFIGQVCIGRVRDAAAFEHFDARGQLSSQTFNPAGTRLALGSWDNTVTVLDVATNKSVLQLVGHTRGVTGVAFSADGLYLATTSNDTTMRIWDADTGQMLQVDHNEFGGGNPAFSRDSQRVAQSTGDAQVRVWPVCVNCRDANALLTSSSASDISPLTPLERALAKSQTR